MNRRTRMVTHSQGRATRSGRVVHFADEDSLEPASVGVVSPASAARLEIRQRLRLLAGDPQGGAVCPLHRNIRLRDLKMCVGSTEKSWRFFGAYNARVSP
jgi:hypothetical protein